MRGLTQQEVAAQGITYRYYQQLERGVSNPSLQMLFDLAQILGVRVSDLVNVSERRPSVDLSEVEAAPPPRGRKPSSRKKRPPK